MKYAEANKYFETLNDAQRVRFNTLVKVGLQLGKPIEGAYSYAHMIMSDDKPQVPLKPAEFVLGPRQTHAHGDEGCFPICPVYQYDLQAKKIQFQLVTARMDEVKRCGDSKYGPARMVALTRRLHKLDDEIKAMESRSMERGL